MKKTQRPLWLLAVVPLGSLLALLWLFRPILSDITGEGILKLLPQNGVLAALALLGLYVLKCFSVFFPLGALQIAAGLRYPYPIAVGLNLLGLILSVSLPFWLGRVTMPELQKKIIERFPKLKSVAEYQNGSQMVFCFLIRVVCVLPGDLLSWYQGTENLRYLDFVVGTVLGKLTGMLLYTLLGDKLHSGITWSFALLYVGLVAANYALVKCFERIARKRGLG